MDSPASPQVGVGRSPLPALYRTITLQPGVVRVDDSRMDADAQRDADDGTLAERLEDAIIDAVTHAFRTLFRMALSWERGESAHGASVACIAELQGDAAGGAGVVSMSRGTAARLAGLIAGREMDNHDSALGDALREFTEMLLIGSTERAGVRGEWGIPGMSDDIRVRAGGGARTMARVLFQCECGPFEVAIETQPGDAEHTPEVVTASAAACIQACA